MDHTSEVRQKDEWWRYLIGFVLLGLAIGAIVLWSNHYHPAKDVCQTAPNSQACSSEMQDNQNCADTAQQC